MSAAESQRKLVACAGSWVGRNTLLDPHNNIDETSDATATVTPASDSRSLQVDYTWSYQGAPQRGKLLVGFSPVNEAATAHWEDSWHMKDDIMSCVGSIDERGLTRLKGFYTVPAGPPWGWRIDLVPDRDRLGLVMYNVHPDGKEELAVNAEFERVAVVR